MALDKKNKRNRTARLRIILLFSVDLLSKYLIFHYQINNELITPLINPGGARSLNIAVPLIIVITAIVLCGFVYLYQKHIIYTGSFILLVAGALGNVYDRIVFHGVRDWIHIGSFPVFNLADVMISLGVLLIALQYRKQSRELRK